MPINPEAKPTVADRATAKTYEASSWLHRHAPVIAAFLAGVLVGLWVS